MYEGESSRNAKIRGAEHLRGLQKKNDGNPMYKHKVNDHQNEEVEFGMRVLKTFKHPLMRLVNEGVS